METTMDLSALALTPWEIALRMLCAMLWSLPWSAPMI